MGPEYVSVDEAFRAASVCLDMADELPARDGRRPLLRQAGDILTGLATVLQREQVPVCRRCLIEPAIAATGGLCRLCGRGGPGEVRLLVGGPFDGEARVMHGCEGLEVVRIAQPLSRVAAVPRAVDDRPPATAEDYFRLDRVCGGQRRTLYRHPSLSAGQAAEALEARAFAPTRTRIWRAR